MATSSSLPERVHSVILNEYSEPKDLCLLTNVLSPSVFLFQHLYINRSDLVDLRASQEPGQHHILRGAGEGGLQFWASPDAEMP